MPSIGEIVADALEQSFRESPDPFKSGGLFQLLTGQRLTYRENLDRLPMNCYGQIISRATLIKRNLRHWQWTKPRRQPNLP